MQCAYCGATLKPGSKFCDACGAEVAQARPPVAPAAPVSEDPIPEAFPYVDPSAQPVEPPVTEPVVASATPEPASFSEIAVAVANSAVAVAPDTNLSVFAIISLVLGILSLCIATLSMCGAILPVVGLILGIISLKSSRRSLAVTGVVLNSISLFLVFIFTIVYFYIFTQPGN